MRGPRTEAGAHLGPEQETKSRVPISTETDALGVGPGKHPGNKPPQSRGRPQAEAPAPEGRDRPSSSLSLHLQRGLSPLTLRCQNQQASPAQGQSEAPIGTGIPASLPCHFPPSGPASTPGTGRGDPQAAVFPAQDEAQRPIERLGGSGLQTLPTEATAALSRLIPPRPTPLGSPEETGGAAGV